MKAFTIEQAARITTLTVKELVDLDEAGIVKATKRGKALSYNWPQLRRAYQVRLMLERGVGKYDAVTLKPKRRIVQDPCPVVYLAPKVSESAKYEAESVFMRACLLENNVVTQRTAEDLHRKAISLNPPWARPYVHLGRLLCLRNLDEEAEDMWTRALAFDPSQSPASYNLAYLCYYRNDFESALRHALRAVAVDPKWADPHWMLAECWTKLGNAQSARTCWIRYIQLSDDDKLKQDAWHKVTRLG